MRVGGQASSSAEPLTPQRVPGNCACWHHSKSRCSAGDPGRCPGCAAGPGCACPGALPPCWRAPDRPGRRMRCCCRQGSAGRRGHPAAQAGTARWAGDPQEDHSGAQPDCMAAADACKQAGIHQAKPSQAKPRLAAYKPAHPARCGSPVGLGGGGALNQVVAVDGGGHGGLRQPRGNELQHRHLGGGILHRHAVCARGARCQRPAGGAVGRGSERRVPWQGATKGASSLVLQVSTIRASSYPGPTPPAAVGMHQAGCPAASQPCPAHAAGRASGAAPTWAQVEVSHAALDLLALGVVQVAVNNLRAGCGGRAGARQQPASTQRAMPSGTCRLEPHAHSCLPQQSRSWNQAAGVGALVHRPAARFAALHCGSCANANASAGVLPACRRMLPTRLVTAAAAAGPHLLCKGQGPVQPAAHDLKGGQHSQRRVSRCDD